MGTYFSKLSEKISEITGHYSAFIIAFYLLLSGLYPDLYSNFQILGNWLLIRPQRLLHF